MYEDNILDDEDIKDLDLNKEKMTLKNRSSFYNYLFPLNDVSLSPEKSIYCNLRRS